MLKSIHFKKTVAQISFLSKYKSKQKVLPFWKKRHWHNCLFKMNRLYEGYENFWYENFWFVSFWLKPNNFLEIQALDLSDIYILSHYFFFANISFRQPFDTNYAFLNHRWQVRFSLRIVLTLFIYAAKGCYEAVHCAHATRSQRGILLN